MKLPTTDIGPRRFGKLRRIMQAWLFVYPVIRELKGHVLDIGCGNGVYMRLYNGLSSGIDIEWSCVEHCQEHGLDVTQADAESYRTERRFDSVLISQVLDHVDHPSDTLKCADRVLKSGGRLVVTVSCLRSFMLGFNDWGGHKQFIMDNYLDYYLITILGYRKVKAHTFPWIDLPYLWRYRERRCVYEKAR